jgi:glycosyltransferase involved in cell wall biosynthesis
MESKISIILTSIERQKSMFESIASILKVLQPNWMIIVGHQGGKDQVVEFSHPQIYCYQLPYNCGISYARNDLIEKAVGLNCNYTLLSADSIVFNESMNSLGFIIQEMEREGYSRCGLDLLKRIPWEATLKLIPGESFELDFIDPKDKEKQLLVPCDIVRNFHISTTESMVKVGYDNDLVMMEHEDEALRYKEAGYKVCCTNFCSGTYKKSSNSTEYDKIREENMRIGRQRLLKKYNLKRWISYANEIPKMEQNGNKYND